MISRINKKRGVSKMYTSHLTEIEPGIFENPNAEPAKSDGVEEHYEKDAIKILDDDKYHYECMARKFKDEEPFTKEFYSVADIAGGHPKLASHLKISGDVTVYDQYAKTYKKTHGKFAERYPISAPVEYRKRSITHHNFTPNAELAICCHILEHLKLDQIRKLLGNLETDKIIVYGPNICRARTPNWFHFRPSDHRTFCTLEAMSRLIAEAGYIVKFGVTYHEDYFIYGDK